MALSSQLHVPAALYHQEAPSHSAYCSLFVLQRLIRLYVVRTTENECNTRMRIINVINMQFCLRICLYLMCDRTAGNKLLNMNSNLGQALAIFSKFLQNELVMLMYLCINE